MWFPPFFSSKTPLPTIPWGSNVLPDWLPGSRLKQRAAGGAAVGLTRPKHRQRHRRALPFTSPGEMYALWRQPETQSHPHYDNTSILLRDATPRQRGGTFNGAIRRIPTAGSFSVEDPREVTTASCFILFPQSHATVCVVMFRRVIVKVASLQRWLVAGFLITNANSAVNYNDIERIFSRSHRACVYILTRVAAGEPVTHTGQFIRYTCNSVSAKPHLLLFDNPGMCHGCSHKV